MKQYSKKDIKEVVQAFKNHEILAFPTDTVYGVGCIYGNLNDLNRLKRIKHRDETKAIPMMVSSIEQMEQVAYVDDRTRRIVEQFLPGPLTLIVPLKDTIDRDYTNGMDTIAIRMPEDDFVLEVISLLNTPLFVTSANQSGASTALTFEDAKEQLPNLDGIVLGTCKELQADIN
ncbi:MAG: threonylcarbamoyl-AMP synthase, partial [Holdemanella sp.]|nr:threonylcarbamoyl-AMP synthase [Holdemanella sp.]